MKMSGQGRWEGCGIAGYGIQSINALILASSSMENHRSFDIMNPLDYSRGLNPQSCFHELRWT